MDIEINNQCAAVVEPKNKNPEMPLRYQLQMELLANQNSRLMEQRDKLLDMVERLESVEKSTAKIEMIQTPVVYAKVGDVVCFDRSNQQLRFGTVAGFTKDERIQLIHSFTVKFGDDNKQSIYTLLDFTIEPYRVCKVLYSKDGHNPITQNTNPKN